MTVHETSLDTEVEPEPVNLRALGELAALQGVVKFPVRIKCATLAWNTLTQGLNDLS
jgi:nitrogen fixation NifU-like protein